MNGETRLITPISSGRWQRLCSAQRGNVTAWCVPVFFEVSKQRGTYVRLSFCYTITDWLVSNKRSSGPRVNIEQYIPMRSNNDAIFRVGVLLIFALSAGIDCVVFRCNKMLLLEKFLTGSAFDACRIGGSNTQRSLSVFHDSFYGYDWNLNE